VKPVDGDAALLFSTPKGLNVAPDEIRGKDIAKWIHDPEGVEQ
jgi:hypothetical protein